MPKEINSETDNSNTIKEITSVTGICKVCILGHGEYALISYNIPKTNNDFPLGTGKAVYWAGFCLLFTPRYLYSFQKQMFIECLS